MGGCSVVVLMMLMWPVLLVVSFAALAATATIEFLTSPAFPVFVIALVCHGWAAIDVVRLLVRKYRERDDFELTLTSFRRPLILICLGFALMVATLIIVAVMINGWWQSLQ